MTQQVCKARVVLPSIVNGTDNCSMDFTFEATGSDTGLDFTDSITPQSALTDFFNTAVGSEPVAYYLSSDLSRASNACSISWTDVTAHLDGSPAGTPFRTDFFTLGASGGGFPMPPQFAAVVAYRRDYGSDLEHGASASLPSSESAIDQGAPATHTGVTRPRARDRGRIYVGPLTSLVQGSTGGGTWAATFATNLVDSFNSLANTQNPTLHNQFNLVQWSRRGASINSVRWYYLDENGGIIRRRGDTTQSRVHPWTAVH